MLKSSWCDYSDAYILAKGTKTITVVPATATDDDANKRLEARNEKNNI